MSIFSEAKTYADLLRLFDATSERLALSRSRIDSLPQSDARQVTLVGMQCVVGGFGMGLSSMIFERSRDQIVASWGRNNLTVDGARGIIEDTWKNGLLTLFHFKVDSLFQNLLRAFGVHREREGFGQMTQKLLAAVKLSDDFRRDVLLLGSYVRNSLHNNGIHRGPDLELTLQDMSFRLSRNVRVECAGWGNVFAIIHETLDVVDLVLATESVRTLAAPVEDQYAMNPVDDWHDPVDYSKGLRA